MDGAGLRARNRSSNMAAIQESAVALMRDSGFDGVTIADVANEAGVSPSTVYRYFGTKEALVLTGDCFERLATVLAADSRPDPAASPAQLVSRALATVLAEVDLESLLGRLQIVFADDALRAAFEHGVLGQRSAIAARLAAHRGANGPGLRDEAAAGAALGLVVAVVDRWQRTGGRKSLAKTLTKALDCVL